MPSTHALSTGSRPPGTPVADRGSKSRCSFDAGYLSSHPGTWSSPVQRAHTAHSPAGSAVACSAAVGPGHCQPVPGPRHWPGLRQTSRRLRGRWRILLQRLCFRKLCCRTKNIERCGLCFPPPARKFFTYAAVLAICPSKPGCCVPGACCPPRVCCVPGRALVLAGRAPCG
jgi:hypothetical protein